MTNDTEAIAVEVIKTNSKPFAMITTYRAPDCNPDIFFDHISNAIKVLDYESKEIYMIGELNCDLLSNRTHRPTAILNSLTEIYQLEQLITEPTRCTVNTRNLIDVAYTNCPKRVLASGVLHLGISIK